jgi:chaperonin GroEL (HSP60 family)
MSVAVTKACVVILGIVPQALDALKPTNFDQTVGIGIIRQALTAPCKQICNNAGHEGAVVVQNVLAKDEQSFGFDASNGMVHPAIVKHNGCESGHRFLAMCARSLEWQ